MTNRTKQLLVLVGITALLGGDGLAAVRTLPIRDYTGWGYAPDLVNYSITVPKGGADKLRVVGPDGAVLPIQISAPAKDGRATLSFVAELPVGETIRYVVRDDGRGAVPPARVTTIVEGDTLVLQCPALALRVPRPVERIFAEPVAANSLPAPILGFRSANGPWLGSGRVLASRLVKALRIRQVANGPVFAEVRYELDFANGGYYHANIQVIDGVPLAKVTEEYDMKELNGRDYWELDLGHGWSPDMVEAPREGRTTLSVAELIKRRPVPGTPGSSGQVWTAELPDLSLLPSYGWAAQAAFYVGLWSEAERQANPDGFVRVCFMPIHKGQWRMTTACEFRTDGQAMSVKLPMSARYANWHEEGASQTSPFSIGQHDPNLPRTYGRRMWALVLAPLAPAWRELGAAPGGYSVPWSKDTPPLFWRTRNWYGVIGLDRYKDYVLQWPDRHVTYPRVFLTPQEQEQYRAAGKDVPLYSMSQQIRWGLTGDPEAAKREMQQFRSYVSGQTKGFLDVVTVGHHDMWGWAQAMADDLLSWPDLPATEREEVRAGMALGGYMWTDPDLMSSGIGDHTGNPNMSTSRQQSFANFPALLPDHPMYEAWRRYTGDFALYKIGEMMAPGGGWFEFGKDYHVHGFYAFPRGFMGDVAMDSPRADQLFPYLKADMEYFVNLLTPVDSRYGARMIPGGANSSIGYYERWLEWLGAAATKDPELAATLKWAYDNNGRNDRDGGVSIETMNRPWIQAREPKLTSQIYPGVGVVFRAHQGPDETYMYFRSGNNWSHWYVDQGHFLLNSKGATLVPSQPYQYYWPENKAFDLFNAIRFGHPENEFAYAWPDSNILDHHFGATVDYAWASVGYPEWYITPGLAAGFGEPRQLAEGAAPQGGAFHWNRQIMFLKGATARSPNYFVFRDTIQGAGRLPSWLSLNLLGRTSDVKQDGGHLAVNTEWPTKLDLVFLQPRPLQLDMAEDNLNVTLGGHWGPAFWQLHEGETNSPSPNWMLRDGSPVPMPLKLYENPGIVEKRVLLRVPNAPGADYFWMIYPREEREALPPVTQLAPNVMKVVTSESTDYVFLSPTDFFFEGEGVVFHGCAGAVRVGKDAVTLNLSGGAGRVGYRDHVVESGVPFERTLPLAKLAKQTETAPAPRYSVAAATGERAEAKLESSVPRETERGVVLKTTNGLRFVQPDHHYVQMTVGTVGVRGVGPFDLTFTDDRVTGKVDGDTRTLVITRPPRISRPMYHMDGRRYYAGFADDSSPDDFGVAPQFNLAFGVLAGPHTVAVAEWEFPSLPPVPERAQVGF